MYLSWLRENGFTGFSFLEGPLFAYLVFLSESHAPPTRAQATREAMHMAGGAADEQAADRRSQSPVCEVMAPRHCPIG